MHNLTFKKAIENAAALLALGQHEVYLSHEVTFDEYPWSLANSVEPGGSHRLDMATSVWFSANHSCGLRFRWSFDIESASANGRGSYEIEAGPCREVMRKLNEPMRAEFRKYLLECAQKVSAKGAEFQVIADRQMRDAATLRDIATAQQPTRRNRHPGGTTMFEVDQTRAFVSSVNMRAEKHGDDNKLASDIKFEVHLSNTILDEFDKGLKAALYREVRKGEQPDLIGDNKFAAVRFPLLDGFRWEEEFTGYKVSIGSELGLVDPLELSDITLKKFAFDPKEGGSVTVTFSAIAHPTSDEAGELCALIQEHVNLSLIAPQAAEQKKAA